MNIYFALDADCVVTAVITPLLSEAEVVKELREQGSDETVIAFISQEGEAMMVLETLALFNIEIEGGICQELERLFAHVFSQGVRCGQPQTM